MHDKFLALCTMFDATACRLVKTFSCLCSADRELLELRECGLARTLHAMETAGSTCACHGLLIRGAYKEVKRPTFFYDPTQGIRNAYVSYTKQWAGILRTQDQANPVPGPGPPMRWKVQPFEPAMAWVA